jgi:hypothetical protein
MNAFVREKIIETSGKQSKSRFLNELIECLEDCRELK